MTKKIMKKAKTVSPKVWGIVDRYGYFSGPYTKDALVTHLKRQKMDGDVFGRVVRLSAVKVTVTEPIVTIAIEK